MRRIIFPWAVMLAFMTSSNAAPIDDTSQIAAFSIDTDPNAAALQARSVLDDVLSRFPTLIDGAATLLDSPAISLLQNVRTPTIPQLPTGLLPTIPQLPNSVLPVPQLNDLLSGFPRAGTPTSAEYAPSSPVAPSLPPSSQSTLSVLLNGALSNLRDVATSPLPTLAAIPGGANSLLNGALQLATPTLPTLPPVPVPSTRITLPLTVWVPNDRGLEPSQLAEQIKRKLYEQAGYTKESPNAQVSLDLLNNVVDVRPLHPKPPTHEPPPSPYYGSDKNPKELHVVGEQLQSSYLDSKPKKDTGDNKIFYVQNENAEWRPEPFATRKEPSRVNAIETGNQHNNRPVHRFATKGSLLSGPADVQLFLKSLEMSPFDSEDSLN